MDSMQWFVGGFMKSRWEVPLTEMVGDRGVADCIVADFFSLLENMDINKETSLMFLDFELLHIFLFITLQLLDFITCTSPLM
jgi:hypothetical protein